MTKTRIRYKNVDHNLISDEFLAVSDLVKVTILTNTLEVNVTNSKGDFLLQSVKQSSLQNAKKLAKKTLVGLGVNFSPEVRPRLTDTQRSVAEVVVNKLGGQ